MVTRIPNTHCTLCKTAIYRRPAQISAGKVYCSAACTGLSQRQNKICKICNQLYVGARRTCSRKCANIARTGIQYTKERTYDKAYQGTLLKNKLAEQRGGACEQCGHDNFAILQVHHKIERYRGGDDKHNNLQLLCPNCHAAHHYGIALYASK